MIPLIENSLTEVLEKQLKAIADDISIIDQIFDTAPKTMRARLKEYILSGKINVIRGFPMDRTALPCYTIMLGGEREVEKTIGAVFDEEESFELENISEVLPIFLYEGKRVVRVSKKPLFSVNSIRYNGEEIYDYTILHDRLGYVEISFEPEKGLTEVEVDYQYKSKGFDGFGTIFNSQFRIETWTNNGDLTVYMYHLLKWMLLSSRHFLEMQGFDLQTIGGMDFEPAPEYFPEFVYRRALTFECLTIHRFGEQFGYIQDVLVTDKTDY